LRCCVVAVASQENRRFLLSRKLKRGKLITAFPFTVPAAGNQYRSD